MIFKYYILLYVIIKIFKRGYKIFKPNLPIKEKHNTAIKRKEQLQHEATPTFHSTHQPVSSKIFLTAENAEHFQAPLFCSKLLRTPVTRRFLEGLC